MRPFCFVEGKHQVLSHDVAIDQFDIDQGGALGVGEVDEVDPVLVGQGFGDLHLAGVTLLDEHFTDLLAGRFRRVCSGFKLLGRRDTSGKEDFTKFLAGFSSHQDLRLGQEAIRRPRRLQAT